MLGRPLRKIYLGSVLVCLFFVWASNGAIAGDNSDAPAILRKQFVKSYLRAEQGYPDAQYAVGMMYYSGRQVPKDITLAIVWFTKAANQNDPDAQYFLSLLYALGDGVAQDDKAAARWCQKAAEQGHADAQHALGQMFSMGQGVVRDDQQAVAWLTKAAEQDHADAQCDLGLMYQAGRGVRRNTNQATQWWLKASRQGHTWSALLLQEAMQADTEKAAANAQQEVHEASRMMDIVSEDLLDTSQPGSVNRQRALRSQQATPVLESTDTAEEPIQLSQAAPDELTELVKPDKDPGIAVPAGGRESLEQTDDPAILYDLAISYYEGKGVPKDDAQAAKWFQNAAEQGHPEAQYKLGVMFSFGHGTPRDSARAAAWFHRAAEQGLPAAQYSLGVMYATGQGLAPDPATAAQWYTKAAEQGSVAAQFMLGLVYSKGQGVTRDGEKAVYWYTQAAEQGAPAAQYLLGVLYEEGKGVVLKDDQISVQWYTKAAYRGHPDAQYRLALKYMVGVQEQRDDIKAYMWFLIAGVNGKKVSRYEQRLEARMTPEQLEQSRQLAREILTRIEKSASPSPAFTGNEETPNLKSSASP